MRVQLDLFRDAHGRIEGVVAAPGGGGGPFTGVLDLLRVLEGIDLPGRGDDRTGDATRGDDDGGAA